LSLVLPFSNDEHRLSRTLETYLLALQARREPFEMIVVSDGSRDRTAEVARSFASRGVRVLEFPARIGKGGAILEGLRQAKYAYVGHVDTEGPIDPSEMWRLLALLQKGGNAIATVSTRVGPSGFMQGVGQFGQDWLLRAIPAAGGALAAQASQSLPEWTRIGTTVGAIAVLGAIADRASRRFKKKEGSRAIAGSRSATSIRKLLRLREEALRVRRRPK
jgi:glycosyltransferase involved in cell wall biosynthesis